MPQVKEQIKSESRTALREKDIQQREKLLRRIDYRNNDLFRYVFGSQDNRSKRILIWFLTAVLKEEIVDVEIKNSEMIKQWDGVKGVRLDLFCEIETAAKKKMLINIEIQNYGTTLENTARMEYYLSSTLVAQVREGETPKESLLKTIHLMICNRMNLVTEEEQYYHEFVMMDRFSGRALPNGHGVLAFLELGKVKVLEKKPMREWSDMDRMAYMLRYSQDEQKHDIIKEISEVEEVFRLMEEKRSDYLQNIADELVRVKAMFDEAEEEGRIERIEQHALEIGQTMGEKKGREIGEEIGKKIGEEIGVEFGIKALVETCQELGISQEEVKKQIIVKFNREEEEAKAYVVKYWK